MENRIYFKNLRFLIVDSDQSFASSLQRLVSPFFSSVNVFSQDSNIDIILNTTSFDFIILNDENYDLSLKFLNLINKEYPLIKVIILTQSDSIDKVVSFMENGAFSCFTKDSPDKIFSLLIEKLSKYKISSNVSISDTGIIGSSEAVKNLLDKIDKLKNINSTILITGDTGTGKELVAKALHNLSDRSNEIYEAINCSAIPYNLLESELFGYKKGAFTDAKTDRIGLFQLCSKGTLFLDEIGDMPINLQAKVLRVLQEEEVRPIGSSTSIKIGTRIIAATNKNLLQEKGSSTFREDLYYRLSVLTINIPPLKDRVEDIPLIIEHYLKKFNKKFNKNVEFPSRFILERLQAYSWPGNIRELKNAVERAVVLTPNGKMRLEDLFNTSEDYNSRIRSSSSIYNNLNSNLVPDSLMNDLSLVEARRNFERNYITKLISLSKGNISQAAKIAKKHRTEIYRLLSRYNIKYEVTDNNNIN